MRIALAQLDPIVGDISGNTDLILASIGRARKAGADLLVTPELAVFGYPPKDLVMRRDIVSRNVEAVERIARESKGLTVLVGYVRPDPTGAGKGVFNSAAVCREGRIEAIYDKTLLPTYDVFDEHRYFNAGGEPLTFDFGTGGVRRRVGVTICEDLWNNRQFEGRRVYGVDPIAKTVAGGADLLINLSASPYRAGIQEGREVLFSRQMREHRVPLIYVNQVGGNDDIIFDGASMVFDETGRLIARAKAFEEDFLTVDLDKPQDPTPALPLASGGGSLPQHLALPEHIAPYPERIDSIRAALVLGIRDYMRKCGFHRVVIGLSGGIDSAVTAALAVEAVGKEHVFGVAMPSRFSSVHSLEDAEQLAQNLGIEIMQIPIEGVHLAFEQAVAPRFGDRQPDATEENMQARIRGTMLMALSNKFGWLLLTTGNKSELAVGYCTLYGDMCGGLAVLSDVPKTTVYELAEAINARAGSSDDGSREAASEPLSLPGRAAPEPLSLAGRGTGVRVEGAGSGATRGGEASVKCELIPRRTIEKPPSAELRENQRDQDTLPPYETLDAILELYVEQDRSPREIVAAGFDKATVDRVVRMVACSEYKRKQAPIGFKVTSRAFGTGRRMPIAAKYD